MVVDPAARSCEAYLVHPEKGDVKNSLKVPRRRLRAYDGRRAQIVGFVQASHADEAHQMIQHLLDSFLAEMDSCYIHYYAILDHQYDDV